MNYPAGPADGFYRGEVVHGPAGESKHPATLTTPTPYGAAP
jgi:hypothetical protein